MKLQLHRWITFWPGLLNALFRTFCIVGCASLYSCDPGSRAGGDHSNRRSAAHEKPVQLAEKPTQNFWGSGIDLLSTRSEANIIYCNIEIDLSAWSSADQLKDAVVKYLEDPNAGVHEVDLGHLRARDVAAYGLAKLCEKEFEVSNAHSGAQKDDLIAELLRQVKK